MSGLPASHWRQIPWGCRSLWHVVPATGESGVLLTTFGVEIVFASKPFTGGKQFNCGLVSMCLERIECQLPGEIAWIGFNANDWNQTRDVCTEGPMLPTTAVVSRHQLLETVGSSMLRHCGERGLCSLHSEVGGGVNEGSMMLCTGN